MPQPLEAVIPQLVHVLDGMLIFGHPRSQVNVVAHPVDRQHHRRGAAVMYNPNLCSDESGRGFSEAEVRVASMAAAARRLRSGGRRRRVHVRRHRHAALRREDRPGKGPARHVRQGGFGGQAVILCSQQSHYACATVAGWLGIGQDNVIRVPLAARQLDRRRGAGSGRPRAARRRQGRSPRSSPRWARPTPSASTTWPRIHALRERLVDGVQAGLPAAHARRRRDRLGLVGVQRLRLRRPTRSAFAAAPCGRWPRPSAASGICDLADSLGIDFHKTGFAPYISSLFLLRDRADFGDDRPRARDDAVSLSHGRVPSRHVHAGNVAQRDGRDGGAGEPAAAGQGGLPHADRPRRRDGRGAPRADHQPAGADGPERRQLRPGDAVSRLSAGRRYVPRQGARAERPVVPAGELRRHNDSTAASFSASLPKPSPAAAWRSASPTTTARRDCGEPICALKSYVLSPFADEEQMHAVVDHVLEACRAVGGGIQ